MVTPATLICFEIATGACVDLGAYAYVLKLREISWTQSLTTQFPLCFISPCYTVLQSYCDTTQSTALHGVKACSALPVQPRCSPCIQMYINPIVPCAGLHSTFLMEQVSFETLWGQATHSLSIFIKMTRGAFIPSQNFQIKVF